MDQNQTNQAKHRPDRMSLGLLIGFFLLAIVAAVGCFYLIRNMVDTWNVTPYPGLRAPAY
jgi:hypothetical protein